MKKYTVFYAWQSDTEQNYDRHPIRNALDMAAEAISGDPSVAAQVIIDSDTRVSRMSHKNCCGKYPRRSFSRLI